MSPNRRGVNVVEKKDGEKNKVAKKKVAKKKVAETWNKTYPILNVVFVTQPQVMCKGNNVTIRHPDILCPIRFDPNEKPLGMFVCGMSGLLCLDNNLSNLAHRRCFNAFELGPA